VAEGWQQDSGMSYPNPGRDHVSVPLGLVTSVYEVRVWDELGRSFELPVIAQSDRGVEIDTRALPAGIYRIANGASIRFCIVR
jgi:hypothetical protein